MKQAKLGPLNVGRIGLGAMGMSDAYTGAGSARQAVPTANYAV